MEVNNLLIKKDKGGGGVKNDWGGRSHFPRVCSGKQRSGL